VTNGRLAFLSPATMAEEWADRVRQTDPLRTVDVSVLTAVADGLVRHVADGVALDGVDPVHVSVDDLVVLRRVAQDRLAASETGELELMHELDRAIDVLILECVHGHLRHLELDAYADPLTGVGNRRALERDLRMFLAQVERYEHALSVVMIDLDGLKSVNDIEGHEAGDTLIRDLASGCIGRLRSGDGLYRIGGDEFVAVLLHADQAAAEAFLGRVRSVAPLFSYGVATAPGDGTDVAGLLDVADQRLLRQRGAEPHRRRTPTRRAVSALKPTAPGIVVESVTTTMAAEFTSVEVSVRHGEAERTGRADGSASRAAEPRLAAAATLDAIRQLGYEIAAAHVDSAEAVSVGAHDVLTVVLSSPFPDGEVIVAGSAVVRRGVAEAAARAVVQAIPPSLLARQIIRI
jgi:diguanylate cyclase (GGDEF)-like protein